MRATNVRDQHSALTMNAQDDPEDTRLLRAVCEEPHTAHLQEQAQFEMEKARLLAIHAEEIEARTKEISDLIGEIERQKAEFASQKSASDQRLQERFREIAGLARVIMERDQIIASERVRAEWLRQVVSVLTWGYSKSPKARLASWLPTYFSHKRQKSRLKRDGLFDPDAYTALYPDVSRSGADPLRHYINHGIKEGRTIRQGS